MKKENIKDEIESVRSDIANYEVAVNANLESEETLKKEYEKLGVLFEQQKGIESGKTIEERIEEVENRGEDTDWKENYHELMKLYQERRDNLKQIEDQSSVEEPDPEARVEEGAGDAEKMKEEGCVLDPKSRNWISPHVSGLHDVYVEVKDGITNPAEEE